MNKINGKNGDNPEDQRTGNEDNNTEEFLDDLKNSLSRQVNETIRSEGAVSYNNNDPKADKNENGQNKRPFGRKFRKILKYVVLPIALFLLTIFVLAKTEMGQNLILRIIGEYSYGKLNYEAPDKTPEVNNNKNEETPGTTTDTGKNVTTNSKFSNILLIGVETFEGAENTDTMIVASLDSENHIIKLTSLMRDLYVKIPGYNDNKLNSVYARKGISLLYDTIEVNFGIKMDGYVLVDFNDFEQIVDYIGGVDIELTATEARYLRNTNYISDPNNRNVVEGTQHMNGNQVLGYCRIRKVSTKTEDSDFGRTQRQRIVLQKIFEKLRKKNVIQLGLIMNNILSNIDISTDIPKSDYNNYLKQAAELKKNAIKTFRVPKDGSFHSERVRIGRYNQDVLVPNSWTETRDMINNFIYSNTASE